MTVLSALTRTIYRLNNRITKFQDNSTQNQKESNTIFQSNGRLIILLIPVNPTNSPPTAAMETSVVSSSPRLLSRNRQNTHHKRGHPTLLTAIDKRVKFKKICFKSQSFNRLLVNLSQIIRQDSHSSRLNSLVPSLLKTLQNTRRRHSLCTKWTKNMSSSTIKISSTK